MAVMCEYIQHTIFVATTSELLILIKSNNNCGEVCNTLKQKIINSAERYADEDIN